MAFPNRVCFPCSIAQGSSARGSSSSSSSASAPRRQLPAPGHIPHATAKEWAPPGACVWRILTPGAWAGRLPPFGEHSRSWRKYSEEGALRELLRVLWSEWADQHGLEVSEVPILGLFEQPSAPPVDSSSAQAQSHVAVPSAGSEAPAPKAAARPKRVAASRARGKATAAPSARSTS